MGPADGAPMGAVVTRISPGAGRSEVTLDAGETLIAHLALDQPTPPVGDHVGVLIDETHAVVIQIGATRLPLSRECESGRLPQCIRELTERLPWASDPIARPAGRFGYKRRKERLAPIRSGRPLPGRQEAAPFGSLPTWGAPGTHHLAVTHAIRV